MSARGKPGGQQGGPPHWGRVLADKVLREFPDRDLYVGAAGISPSGPIHIGNFRDIVTTGIVLDELQRDGHATRLIFSWDDYDRYRKVPAGVPAEYEQYLGKPLCDIPDPAGEFGSYAERHEKEFEASLARLGIAPELRYQSREYRSGRYDLPMLHALRHRKKIAEILAGFRTQGMTEAEVEAYYPISVYSRFTGKDSTRVLGFDGDSTVTYECLETGKRDEVDLLRDRVAKLAWKVDWAMRWDEEDVVFEPGGSDHSSPAGSFATSKLIAGAVYDRKPPVYEGYAFIGIRGAGAKMSGSVGNSVVPGELLRLYEPELLLWLFSRARPNQAFEFAFDSEIFRQYDEFDREVARLRRGKLPGQQQRAVEYALETGPGIAAEVEAPIPFRQAVSLGQIVQFDTEKMAGLVRACGGSYDPACVNARLGYGRTWLEYNPDEKIEIRDTVNEEYAASMTEAARGLVARLADALCEDQAAGGAMTVKEWNDLVYGIPKLPENTKEENAPLQRAFFADIYNLLIGDDTGPRLSTFLWALDRHRVIDLLRV